jgi:Common central domain of tyrosinase
MPKRSRCLPVHAMLLSDFIPSPISSRIRADYLRVFPTWHRAYVLRLETALRESEVAGADNIAMPYWDEADDVTFQEGGQ